MVRFLFFLVFINKLKTMQRRIRLTESELTRIIRRVINEQQVSSPNYKGDGGVQVSSPNYKGDGGVQVSSPNYKGDDGIQVSAGMPQKFVSINPKIQIDCSRRVIVYTQLPNLDKTASSAIVNHYCKNKK